MRAKGRGTEPDGPFTSINQANQQFELIIQGTTPVIPPVREQRVRRVLQAIEGGRLRSVTDLAREAVPSAANRRRAGFLWPPVVDCHVPTMLKAQGSGVSCAESPAAVVRIKTRTNTVEVTVRCFIGISSLLA